MPLAWGAAPFQETYDWLLEACRSVVLHRSSIAREMIEPMVQPRVGPELTNAQLLGHLVAESLMQRVDHRLLEAKNIYLESFDIPQIEFFYQMSVSYPQVSAAHDLANQYHAHLLADLEELSLFEIGIGKGAQVVQLLERVARQHGRLRHVRVFALDPDAENLSDAGGWLSRTGERLGIRVTYVPICARLEDLTEDELRAIRSKSGSATLVVNAAFAFHHTTHRVGDDQYRTELLARMGRVLRPRLLTLVEPNANHDVEHLPTRFDACWRHFGLVFDLIDESGLPPEVCFSIKEKFFGREIRDIFGSCDAFRCERHELVDRWLLRLTKAGFSPCEGDVPLEASMPEYCDAAVSPGLVRLGYRGRPLIGVMAMQWDPERSRVRGDA
ncbi:MAG: hypothetical protein KDK70_25315 [Myxococcales bacterium]|nr:hypothetical protein [Myxococcales bacterium]